MLSALIIIGLLIIAFFTFYAYVMCRNVRSLAEISLRPFSSEKGLLDAQVQITAETHKWAGANGFSFVGYFHTEIGKMSVVMAAWKHKAEPTFLCHNLLQTFGSLDLTTLLSGARTVTTTSIAEAFPRPPGSYAQSFPGADLDQLWQRHTEAKSYLLNLGGAKLDRADRPFEHHICQETRGQSEHIRSYSLWQLRTLYWHYVRKRRWRNLSVTEQHARRMIELPNELARSAGALGESVSESLLAAPVRPTQPMGQSQSQPVSPLAIVEGRTDPAEIALLLERARPMPEPQQGHDKQVVLPVAQPLQAEPNEQNESSAEEPHELEGISELPPDEDHADQPAQEVSEVDMAIESVQAELALTVSKEKSWVKGLGTIVISLVAFVALGFFRFSPIDIGILLLVIFVHELGHTVAMKVFGYRDVHMLFIPLLGGAAAGKERNPSGSRKAMVALLGPVPGIALGVGFAIAYSLTLQEVFAQVARASLFINVFNLLPFHPLDGARLLEHAVFSRRPKVEIGFKLLTGGLLALLAVLMEAMFLLFLAIFLLIALRSTYRTAKIAATIRGQIPTDVELDTDQIPKPYLAQIVSFFMAKAGPASKSAKALASLARSVWLRVCNKQPSAITATALVLLYLWTLLLGLVLTVWFVVEVQKAQEAINDGLTQPVLARYLLAGGIIFLLPMVQLALLMGLWRLWKGKKPDMVLPTDVQVGAANWSLKRIVALVAFWGPLPAFVAWRWKWLSSRPPAALLILLFMIVCPLILAAILTLGRPRPAGRRSLQFLKTAVVFCWFTFTVQAVLLSAVRLIIWLWPK